MKKFLVMLMVVAMASFLFVGCMPSVTPPVEEDEEEEEVVVPKTDTPYITNIGPISLSSTATQYVTAPPTVTGVGVAGAIIKVYIDGVQSGVGSSGTGGSFTAIPVSMITLKEGVRKLYITATVPGLAESDKSTEYTFTYDKTEAKIATVTADNSSDYYLVTFDEVVVTSLADATNWADSALNPLNWNVNGNGYSTADLFTKVSDTVIRITDTANAVGAAGSFFTVECKLIKDLAGNAISGTTPATACGFVQP